MANLDDTMANVCVLALKSWISLFIHHSKLLQTLKKVFGQTVPALPTPEA
jgi:hypothetical protein